MATVPHGRARRKVEYPTTDGRPMGETPLHGDILYGTIQVLKQRFALRDPSAYVSGNMMMYYVEGDPKKYLCPDVFVTLGIGSHYRDIYLVWEERAPDLIIEVTSKSTHGRDVKAKLQLYQDELKVHEHFLFDPRSYLKPPLQGYRRVEGRYEAIASVDGRLPSEILGLHLERHGQQLRLYDPTTGQWLPTHSEELLHRDAALADKDAALRAAQDENERLRRENEALRRRSDRLK